MVKFRVCIVNAIVADLNLRQGTMTFGEPGKLGARVHDIKDVEAILETFKSHGHTEVSCSRHRVQEIALTLSQIDTARAYTGGTSEEYLGRLDLSSQGFKLETKLYPTVSLVSLNFS